MAFNNLVSKLHGLGSSCSPSPGFNCINYFFNVYQGECGYDKI